MGRQREKDNPLWGSPVLSHTQVFRNPNPCGGLVKADRTAPVWLLGNLLSLCQENVSDFRAWGCISKVFPARSSFLLDTGQVDGQAIKSQTICCSEWSRLRFTFLTH